MRAMTRKQRFDYSHLTPTERLELAQELWDSVDHTRVEWPLTEAQRNELDRRLEEYDTSAIPTRVRRGSSSGSNS
jgi:putative addiction module component (TIGR02574 family)